MIKIFNLSLFKKKKENVFFIEEAECEKLVIDLIDEWISCSLNTGDCALIFHQFPPKFEIQKHFNL